MAASLRSSPSVPNSAATGVILAIDYGQKRLGLALSDKDGSTARPFETWTRTNRRRDLARLRDLVRKEGICRIVVGLPLHLDGTPSELSEESERFAARVEKVLGIPVEMMDERLSSWEAKQIISATNSRPRSRRAGTHGADRGRKGLLDDVAAAIILRDYLDQARRPSGLRD
jgi:putative holliday junction resolvase